jgi:ubiquinone/menaquinone biosynthesis C-methylase UbiE
VGEKSQARMAATYDARYAEAWSFRDNWFGDISRRYILPNYYRWTDAFLRDLPPASLVELGAGDGEMTDLIQTRRPAWCASITPSDVVEAGAERLRAKGYRTARQADACATPFGDDEFDVAIAYDVMHHVADPAAMAREMVRIARRRVFLIEANGASLMRRLLELTDLYRKAGENSYLPRRYRGFFTQPGVARVDIDPLQFVPPKFLSPWMPLTIAVSEALQHIPVLRWQCSGVRIRVTLDKRALASR